MEKRRVRVLERVKSNSMLVNALADARGESLAPAEQHALAHGRAECRGSAPAINTSALATLKARGKTEA
jgi:hypothetical protein